MKLFMNSNTTSLHNKAIDITSQLKNDRAKNKTQKKESQRKQQITFHTSLRYSKCHLKKKSICLKLGKKDETGSTGYHQNMKLDCPRENISEVRWNGTESLSQTLYQHSIYTTTADTL